MIAGAQDINHLTHVDSALAAAALGRGEQRPDILLFQVGEIARIPQPVTVTITAAVAPLATRSRIIQRLSLAISLLVLVPLIARAQAPEPAKAVGYNLRTFGPTVGLGSTWHKFNFFGVNPASITVKQNTDGSITIAGPDGDNYGAQLSTASLGTTINWAGIAFGGGAFFEASMSFKGDYNGPGPAFWANDIENMVSGSAGNGNIQWPGQAGGYGNWIETDFVEFNASGRQYGIAMHNWYGSPSGINDVSTGSGSGSPITTPPGTDFSQPHNYGFLWVPATASTQGYAKWYFDDVQVGHTVTWNPYNSSLAPPPVVGSSAFSILDTRHLALILGTGGNSVTIFGVSVWQRLATKNIMRNYAR